MQALNACTDDVSMPTATESTSTSDVTTESVPTTGNTDATSTTDVIPTTSMGEGDCDSSIQCGANEVCIDGPTGNCVCRPGWVLCGTECVDIHSDANHCGRCNAGCGDRCASGICGEVLPPGQTYGPATVIAGVEAPSSCVFYNEAKPERSINYFSDGIQYFVEAQRTDYSGDHGWHNWSDLTSIWDGSTKQTPKQDPGYRISSDPWSATHGGTGLEYVSIFGNRPMEARCVMVAATDASSMRAGVWQHPFECASTPGVNFDSLPDGPVIVSDLGDDAIYIAFHFIDLGLSRLILQRYSPCNGVPRPDNSGGCPLQWETAIPVKQLQEHPNVVINPCTHHPLVLYRNRPEPMEPLDQVRVSALNTMTGDEIVNVMIDEVLFEENSRCGASGGCPSDQEICKCGGADTASCSASAGGGCMDLAARVHGAALWMPDGQCALLAAYDYSAVAADNETYMKSKLKVFLLNGDTPVEMQEIKSSMDSETHNDFNGTVLTDQFTGRTGFFFYRQEAGNPCDTYYMGGSSGSSVGSCQCERFRATRAA